MTNDHALNYSYVDLDLADDHQIAYIQTKTSRYLCYTNWTASPIRNPNAGRKYDTKPVSSSALP